jgi:hypothetical protein
MDDFFENWTIQVRKGVLELCLLSALDGGEHYGYALVKRLSATPDSLTPALRNPALARPGNTINSPARAATGCGSCAPTSAIW